MEQTVNNIENSITSSIFLFLIELEISAIIEKAGGGSKSMRAVDGKL